MGLSLALSRRLPEAERTLRAAAANPKAGARTRGDLALVLALEGKYAEAEQVSRTDLSSEAARANVDAIRRMLAAGDPRWHPAKPAAPAGERRRLRRQSSWSPIDDVGCGSMLGPAPAGRIGGTGSVSATGGGSAPFGPSSGPVRDIGARAIARFACVPPSARDVERLFDLRGRRQAVGGGGRRQEARRGRRPADPPRARVGRAVVGEIEVDMIVVEDVRARSEHGGEVLTGAGVDLVQERRFLGVGLFPVAHERRACARPPG